jgi:catechol 2,3-dioxygenase-like lactoylglutathione lyase family enzyme
MKRFHVHVGVADLDASIHFYSALFGAEPTVRKHDYAKWMVDDPRLNFAISQRGNGRSLGVNHLGLQVDSDDELETLHGQARAADLVAVSEKNVKCCYAKGNKYWYKDPAGVPWETYHTLQQVEFFGEENAMGTAAPAKQEDACCGPKATLEPGEAASAVCCR